MTPKKPTPKAKKVKARAPKPKKAFTPPSTGYWLLKSEPESYSIDQFEKDKKTLWTGVRNYLARNFMTDSMKPGDQFLFYHSNAEPPGIVGLGEVVRAGVPDPTALDPKSDYYDPKAAKDHPIWTCAEVKFVRRLPLLSLESLKSVRALSGMALLARGQRLSVQQVTAKEWATILELAET